MISVNVIDGNIVGSYGNTPYSVAYSKDLYAKLLEFSNEDQFSPQIYEFMFNINGYCSPDEYINRTRNNVFTEIFDNLYSDKSMNSNESKKTNLDLLTLIGENFLTYNCSNCGHSVRNHIWQCPSCNHWETFKPNTISDRVAIND